MGCFSSFDIEKGKIKDEIEEIKNYIFNMEIKNSIPDHKIRNKEIEIKKKLNEVEEDTQIKEGIKEFYNLLNKKEEKNEILKDFDRNIKKLERLFGNRKNRKKWDKRRKKRKNRKFLKEIKEDVKTLKKIPDYPNLDISERFINSYQIQKNEEKKGIIKSFFDVKEKIKSQIDDIQKQKQEFIIKFNSIANSSFIYPDQLKNNFEKILDNIELSFSKFKEDLYSYNKKINKKIKKIISNEVNLNEAKKILDDLEKKINNLNNKQKNEETNAIQEKKDIITKALIDYRKNVITEKIKNITASFKQIDEKIN